MERGNRRWTLPDDYGARVDFMDGAFVPVVVDAEGLVSEHKGCEGFADSGLVIGAIYVEGVVEDDDSVWEEFVPEVGQIG